jgi:large subunit ribosomal protein L13
LATHVATLLQGKDRPTFDPSSRAGGDVCVVVNADSVVLTGRKWERKTYRTHTGYPGGVKEQSATELWRRDPARLVEKAVAGMLPRSGAARRDRLRKLKVFSGADHPFAGGGALELIPSPPPARVLRDKGQGWPMPEGFEPMNPEAYARRMRGVKGGGGGASGGGAGVKVRPAGGEALPAFDDLLAAGEVEVVRKGGNGGGGGGAAAGGK